MTIGVSVSPGEIAGLNRWFGELDNVQAKANRRALLKAGKKAAGLSVKEIATRAGVKQKIIRRRLKAFPAPFQFRGRGDFIRVWLGLRAVILPKHDRRVAKAWPNTFEIRTRAGGVVTVGRRPNPLFKAPRSTHRNPSPSGRPNPNRNSLPVDKVREVLTRARMEPIIFRHARHAAVTVYPAEFRRLLELNARRAARR